MTDSDTRRVVVTGLGVVAPNGSSTRDFWVANLNGRSGIDIVTCFDAPHYPSRIAGQVKNFNPVDHLPEKTARKVDRFVHLALAAAKEAIEDSRIALDAKERNRAGAIIGSGLGGVLFHEEQMMAAYTKSSRNFNPLAVPRITPNAVAAHIAIQYQLLGPNYVISTACASGSHAIGESFRKIQTGEADIIVSGGVEAPLTQFTFGAYCALRGVLSKRNSSPMEASRPFDRDRDGFVMSEGAGILVLEEHQRATKRGAPIYAEVLGYGQTSGAYHMVMPQPDGGDAARTMALALADAGLSPEEVDYINAHGTSTVINDIAETRAIKKVFGDRAYRIPISATKSMIGHTIGAAGAIEAAVSCLAIKHQIIPPTINYGNPDPECDLDYVPNHAREARLRSVLSNSFGFGSVNACLVFAEYG